VGVFAPYADKLSLTPPPPPHRKSGVPDLRIMKPVSGKPEMGGEESRLRYTSGKRSAASAHVLTLFLTPEASLAVGGLVLFPRGALARRRWLREQNTVLQGSSQPPGKRPRLSAGPARSPRPDSQP
jgi:hypothetical protein